MARELEAFEGQQRHEVTCVQTRRRRVEARVQRDGPAREGLTQCVEVGGLRDQTSPLEFVEDVDGCGSALGGRGPDDFVGRVGGSLSLSTHPSILSSIEIGGARTR